MYNNPSEELMEMYGLRVSTGGFPDFPMLDGAVQAYNLCRGSSPRIFPFLKSPCLLACWNMSGAGRPLTA